MAKGLRGVKDDLSELGRHLLDIACFLGPILSTAAHHHDSSPRAFAPSRRSAADLDDDGETFRSGSSGLSGTIRIPDLPPGKVATAAAGGKGFGGVSEEVRCFVEDLVNCPESWLEFPAPLDDEFDISLPQRDHIIAVEELVPSLATLRDSLCAEHLSEERFWKIYFVLLHPRLSKHEAEVLSTHQIVETIRIPQKKTEEILNVPLQIPGVVINDRSGIQEDADQVQEVSTAESTTIEQYIDRQLENPSESDAASYDTRKQFYSEDDVSFSGTEDEDHVIVLKHSPLMKTGQTHSPSTKWIQLRQRPSSSWDRAVKVQHISEEKEWVNEGSSEWLNVGDSDFEISERSG